VIRVVPLGIDSDEEVGDMALGPRGEGLVVTVGSIRRDIWILKGLFLPGGR
jgi:hypothetical protein